jgi:S-adenosylmethionine:tRNA ribosyltransferase-isomerase
LPGARVEFQHGKLNAEVLEWREGGRRIVRFEADGDFDQLIDRIGRTPLPPYIKRDEEDRLDAERYQTVFAKERGAVAAPTAGLHFTRELLERVKARGAEIVEITLHVGYGTFQPVRVERVEDHRVEPEVYSISDSACVSINRALDEGRRVIAVGTTTTRALESAAREQMGRGAEEQAGGDARRGRGAAVRPTGVPRTATTGLFIYPGFEFRVVGGLVTNFHLPCSSLLMLVTAFGGYELVMKAYRHAVEQEYRFYSYGDAMLVV